MSKRITNQPSEVELAASDRCSRRIKGRIHKQDGIGFDEYMQIALYEPELGFYLREHQIFGQQGDYITAPEVSSHLAYCLAQACAKLICDDGKRVILEIGAGSGKLCCEILKCLATLGRTPGRYYIYETSPVLRIRQRKMLEKELPEYIGRVRWLTDLACELGTAIVIANEVLDAQPVKCFEIQAQRLRERVVALGENDEFVWCAQAPGAALSSAFDGIATILETPFPEHYQSEINLNLEPMLASWANTCRQCIVFLIDYGYPRHEYYHPQRNRGTLRCYFRHQVSEDVFVYPSLQDITADVDFSAVSEIASCLQMQVLAFGSQRNFMLANRLLEWRPTAQTEVGRLAQLAQLKQLTLGSAMSERFQVMVLGKGIDYAADCFTVRDMRARL